MENEKNNENVIGLYEVVRDRYGKKHKVYSAKLKDMQTVTHFTERYNPDSFGLYLFSPVVDEDGEIEHDAEGNINYDNGFREDLMEIIDLALDHRESHKQIEEWLDLDVARLIIITFLRVSQFKKNNPLNAERRRIGEILSPVLSKTQA